MRLPFILSTVAFKPCLICDCFMFAGFWKAWSQSLGGQLPATPCLACLLGKVGAWERGEQWPPIQPPQTGCRVHSPLFTGQGAILGWEACLLHSNFKPNDSVSLSCSICLMGIVLFLRDSSNKHFRGYLLIALYENSTKPLMNIY